MVPCTPVLRGLSQRGPSIEAWGPCVAVAHLSGCQLDKHPYVWAHLRRRPHIQPLPILCVVTASRFLSSRYCAFLGRVLLRRFFPFLLQRVRWGAQFPDGTEALILQSPCQAFVKGEVPGPLPLGPVSPLPGTTSSPRGPCHGASCRRTIEPSCRLIFERTVPEPTLVRRTGSSLGFPLTPSSPFLTRIPDRHGPYRVRLVS